MISGLAQVIAMKPIFRSFFSGAMASSAPNGKTDATAAYAVDAPTARRKRRRASSRGTSARITADSMARRLRASSSSVMGANSQGAQSFASSMPARLRACEGRGALLPHGQGAQAGRRAPEEGARLAYTQRLTMSTNTVRFGRFEVQPEARQLLVNGVPAKLGARAFDVLLALIERRDRVVGKDELLDLVWPGLVVEENNLQVQISALRKLLGPDAVATIPGRGYQFTVSLGAPAAASTVSAHGLPEQRTHFIGRERELTELRADARGGVIFVPLAPVQEPALVAATIALAAGVRELKELRGRDALLVLDNFEHLLPAAAEVSTLLSLAPDLKILVTSRARLRLTGEQEYALDPLPPSDAAEFFLDRARAVRPDLRSHPAVSAICERLDGLPLALELAASRGKVLDPSLLLERLARSLPLLTGGTRDAPERQQTLRATIGWSYTLLEEPLQRAFHRLAVFPGSFSLEAAEVVARTDLDQVTALVDWSLLKPVAEGRFLMLETIREFGRERIEGSSERDEIRDRHLGFFLQLVEQAEPKLTGPEQRRWYDRLVVDNDNLREALAYACESRDGERALMLAGTIWRFWWNRGRIAEASLWYERAFAVGQNASPTT